MYNVQNLYGSIAGINSKIYELENHILHPKQDGASSDANTEFQALRSQVTQLEAKVNGLTSDIERTAAVLNTMMNRIDTLVSHQTTKINTDDPIEETQTQTQTLPVEPLPIDQPAVVPPAVLPPAEEVFELVPPKHKGGRKKRT